MESLRDIPKLYELYELYKLDELIYICSTSCGLDSISEL